MGRRKGSKNRPKQAAVINESIDQYACEDSGCTLLVHTYSGPFCLRFAHILRREHETAKVVRHVLCKGPKKEVDPLK
jgi:hypothetical protein